MHTHLHTIQPQLFLYTNIHCIHTLLIYTLIHYIPLLYACRCAHDRHRFGKAGWGRLSIGLYTLYLAKWYEHFPSKQVLVTRLEDYDTNPKAYMTRIFNFLSVTPLSDNDSIWESINAHIHYNSNPTAHEPMLPQTEVILRAFYQPYNDLLAAFLRDDKYKWTDALTTPSASLLSATDLTRTLHPPPPQTPPIPPLLLHPHSFDITHLPMDTPGRENVTYTRMEWVSKHAPENTPPTTAKIAKLQLSIAIAALDIHLLKYLLYDIGIPYDVYKEDPEYYHTPLHSLASITILFEGHSKSLIFDYMKSTHAWINEYMTPPLPELIHSVHTYDLISSIEPRIDLVMDWLLEACGDPSRAAAAVDVKGFRCV